MSALNSRSVKQVTQDVHCLRVFMRGVLFVTLAAETILERTLFSAACRRRRSGKYQRCRHGVHTVPAPWCSRRRTPAMRFTAWPRAVRISASSPDGREMFLNIMEPGDTFGEIALLDGRPRTATASATAPSELIIIMRDHFLALLERDPSWSGTWFSFCASAFDRPADWQKTPHCSACPHAWRGVY